MKNFDKKTVLLVIACMPLVCLLVVCLCLASPFIAVFMVFREYFDYRLQSKRDKLKLELKLRKTLFHETI